ncbi:hypothetical protein SMI01S_16600 [Sphingobacterium mizutaii NBRC 14946 = DSM 11724]|uniref:Uncharacterized protein n=2 Tax=Sphingobacterium mizutaii TaxID=1010 RepID=A0AAJ4X8H3_9SPHI|nr:hypothetical protein SMI01S_16600 [Sphingobacterium mizutaii NBRC 14946 = DSM 11724]SDL77478.1 hypothetical protein SAMN05192578_10920 [Sphingobacterium mizutaii]SNV38183.1 Uncharacterised protein [Sphingobacterium mizutaii]
MSLGFRIHEMEDIEKGKFDRLTVEMLIDFANYYKVSLNQILNNKF